MERVKWNLQDILSVLSVKTAGFGAIECTIIQIIIFNAFRSISNRDNTLKTLEHATIHKIQPKPNLNL